MNYIYDVIVNFNPNFYDFYEWNKSDKLTHIRKIPSFKISQKDLLNIKNNQILIDENIFNRVYNKTEKFDKNDVKKMKNACLFSDGKDVVAIEFDKKRINYFKSSLSIDEQEDITDIINYQKEVKINYKIIKKNKNDYFKTRFEIENENYIKNKLKKMYKNDEYKKLNYIHLECFGVEEHDMNKAIKKIEKEITKGNDNFYKIFKIFKMTNHN